MQTPMNDVDMWIAKRWPWGNLQTPRALALFNITTEEKSFRSSFSTSGKNVLHKIGGAMSGKKIVMYTLIKRKAYSETLLLQTDVEREITVRHWLLSTLKLFFNPTARNCWYFENETCHDISISAFLKNYIFSPRILISPTFPKQYAMCIFSKSAYQWVTQLFAAEHRNFKLPRLKRVPEKLQLQ